MAVLLPPIPNEPIGETHTWREWFFKVRASGFTPSGILSGVSSLNGRSGVVTVASSDVTSALGYVPPTPTGIGASGTWGISITGNAATVTNGVYTNAANSFSLINPLTTLAESWIGPSTTTGVYFKGGNVGIGTTSPGTNRLQVVGGNTAVEALTATSLTVTAAIVGSVTGSSGSTTGNAATVTTNANLTGEVTSVGNATTITNAAVLGKVITGFVSGAGVVAATDTILQAIDKLDGNIVALRTLGYTVGTLPIGTIGQRAYVTDATAPTFLGSLVGGGTVFTPVIFNGTSWIAG